MSQKRPRNQPFLIVSIDFCGSKEGPKIDKHDKGSLQKASKSRPKRPKKRPRNRAFLIVFIDSNGSGTPPKSRRALGESEKMSKKLQKTEFREYGAIKSEFLRTPKKSQKIAVTKASALFCDGASEPQNASLGSTARFRGVACVWIVFHLLWNHAVPVGGDPTPTQHTHTHKRNCPPAEGNATDVGGGGVPTGASSAGPLPREAGRWRQRRTAPE